MAAEKSRGRIGSAAFPVEMMVPLDDHAEDVSGRQFRTWHGRDLPMGGGFEFSEEVSCGWCFREQASYRCRHGIVCMLPQNYAAELLLVVDDNCRDIFDRDGRDLQSPWNLTMLPGALDGRLWGFRKACFPPGGTGSEQARALT